MFSFIYSSLIYTKKWSYPNQKIYRQCDPMVHKRKRNGCYKCEKSLWRGVESSTLKAKLMNVWTENISEEQLLLQHIYHWTCLKQVFVFFKGISKLKPRLIKGLPSPKQERKKQKCVWHIALSNTWSRIDYV